MVANNATYDRTNNSPENDLHLTSNTEVAFSEKEGLIAIFKSDLNVCG